MYNKLAIYRRELALSNHFEIVKHRVGYPIGVAITYSKLLTLNNRISSVTIDVADGLDGSGSYKVCNQVQSNVDLSTKNFILLFAFKILKITSKNGEEFLTNDTPHSPCYYTCIPDTPQRIH